MSLEDYLVGGKLPKLEKVENVNHVGKNLLSKCDSISTATTFTTNSYQETFKIQKGPLNCNSQKVVELVKCGKFPMLGKRKPNRKVPQKRFHAY